MCPFSIVKAEAPHFEGIAALEKECFADPWKIEDIIRAASNPAFVCFAALAKGAVAGYGMMFVSAGESEIVNIAAAPTYRRLGIAEGIMKTLIGKAKEYGAEAMYLEVRESNFAARRLYEKLSFEIIGRRKNYYKKPSEDALLMAKGLGAFSAEK